ncbi:glycoside hydrolase superfamily [Mycena floridula]|nr:glycoside hydrolase superfamily [Mycena floridula]
MLFHLALIPFAVLPVIADVITGVPDAAPPGFEEWVSPVVVPAKRVSGDGDWSTAVSRAKAFVAKLTLAEKVNATTGTDLAGRCVGNTGSIPRFNWPGLCLQDGPLGVRLTDGVSVFPVAINVAATWDRDLILQRAQAMGAEFKGKGVNTALAPMMNLARVPEAGRNWEGFGGDPFLSGAAAALTVQGIQSNGVMSTAKHFVGNEQEHFRGGSLSPQISSSNIDDQTLHEVYAWPFAESVKAGTTAYMCSYQKVNQTQMCQNSKLINGLLKEELDFQGIIMSDWAAMIEGVQPALAGLDLNMPGFKAYGLGDQEEANPANATNSFWGAALVEAVNNGSVPVSRLDDMVTRIFAAYYKLGQDRNYPPVNFDVNHRAGLDNHVNVQGDHAKVIRKIGGASTILLKNTASALPLSLKGIKQIGVFGTDAVANPAGPNACSDRSCNVGVLACGWGSGTANFPYLVAPLDAINAYVASKHSSVVVKSVASDTDLAQVASVASASDVCLVFTAADSGEGYINVEGNQGDRNDLNLWHSGDDLITATANACNNTIVVMNIVGAVLVEKWIDHPNVKAVLHAGLQGQEAGNAIVDVLFGAVNPSAKLPYTMAKAREDYPGDVVYTSSMSTPQITYSEGLEIDYRHFDAKNIAPRFEFGFGLSYTTFSYSSLSIERTLTGFGGLWDTALRVSYRIVNKGNFDGNEVSQLYLSFPPEANQPPKILRGFEKTFIPKGQSAWVTLTLRVKDVSYWNVKSQKWLVPSKPFTAHVGGSSRNLPLTATFTV